ncbi:MAG TPA: hypothetical protein VK211_29110 [Kamptonema sp.]|nr:hypothetical protein [Kamptonema sp.]
MGIQGLLFGGGGKAASGEKGGDLASGGHAINRSQVLAPTDAGAISPLNPGNFTSIRSTPVVPAPRYFAPEEADALAQLEKEKAIGAKASKKAYKKLGKIEGHDATVHKAHRKYEGEVADHELTKKQADARLGRHLHALRPQYARLGFGLERAEQNADRRISELKSKVAEAWK